jgi:hypothetical protein
VIAKPRKVEITATGNKEADDEEDPSNMIEEPEGRDLPTPEEPPAEPVEEDKN